jgi:adenosylhomocysteine nucleosidase
LNGLNDRGQKPLLDADVLLIAADAREYSGVLNHCLGVKAVGLIGWSRVARLGDYRVLMVANGAGPRLASAAVVAARAQVSPKLVVSFGLCGALDPLLRIGDICVGTEVICGDRTFPAGIPVSGRPFHLVRVISVDRVVGTAEEKRQLRNTGASAVEMEAAGVAASVREWELPFLCIRSVSDLATETFALDINSARMPDGRISAARVVGSALRRPWKGLPELARLQRQGRIAAGALGDFLADCRF